MHQNQINVLHETIFEMLIIIVDHEAEIPKKEKKRKTN